LLAARVNILVVAERLGHADPAVTLRVYAHLMPNAQAEAAARIDAIFP
jgi:integrase